jgi:hypothetical protein
MSEKTRLWLAHGLITFDASGLALLVAAFWLMHRKAEPKQIW